MYCMKCGAQNDDTARFCISCGAALATLGATRPPPPPPPVPVQPRPARPAAPARPKRGFPRWLVTCGVLALALLCLCGAVATGAYFWLGLHRTNETAKIVPADTPLLISFAPDPRQAVHFRDVKDVEALAPVFGAVPQLRQTAEEAQAELLKEFDIDWQKDVLPWIGGEASLAMMDTAANGYRDTPPIILAVATRNEKKSDAFLQKVRQAMEREGVEFDEEVYRDTRVVYVAPDYEGALAPAFATFNHLVVVGTDREALHQAIDTAQSKAAPVLADREAYKAVLKELPANRLGYVYLDGETFLRDLQAEVDLPLEWEAVRGVGASFGLADDGVRFDFAASYDLDLLTKAQREAMQRPVHRLKTADLAPGAAVAYWSGLDLFASWEASVANVEGAEDIEYFVEELEYETGVHLVDDVLAQMTGEVALIVLPDRAGLFGDEEVPLGFLLLAEADDPRALEASLDDLAGYLAEEGGADLRRQEIEGVTFTLLENPWAEWALGYGFVDDVLVIGASPGVLRAVVRDRDEPLSAEKMFQAALEPLPARASSYLFLDVQEAIRIVYKAMDEYDRKAFNRDLRPYLEPIRAISLGVESVDKDGTARGTLFLYTGEK